MKPTRKTAMSLWGLLVATCLLALSAGAVPTVVVSYSSVTILDTHAPVIALVGDPAVTLPVGAAFADPGVGATDNIDGNVTARVSAVSTVNMAVPGSYTVTYSVSDAAGNPASPVVRQVTVFQPDTTPPVITLLGNPAVTVEVQSTYTDAGATATDNVDGNITPRIVTVNPVNTAKLGSYTVTYDVKDNAGNAAKQVVRSVKVVDRTPPVITLNPPNVPS